MCGHDNADWGCEFQTDIAGALERRHRVDLDDEAHGLTKKVFPMNRTEFIRAGCLFRFEQIEDAQSNWRELSAGAYVPLQFRRRTP